MGIKLREAWKDEMQAKIDAKQPIDFSTAVTLATTWLVLRLTHAGIPYKIFNLGAGVKRITTDTDTCPCYTCPCCKQTLKGKS